MAREASIQMPTNSNGGSTHDSSVPICELVATAEILDVMLGQRVGEVLRDLDGGEVAAPSGSFSDSVPRIVSPAIVTLLTLPSFSNCWN